MDKETFNGRAAMARQEDLVVQEMPDEVLVYDLKRHEAHCLNKTAAFIWQHCDGQTTIAEIAQLLHQEAGSPVDEEVVWYALEKLSKAELLDEKLTLPVKDALSRRRMIKRLGAMIAVPTVMSVIAPTALAQATVVVVDKKISQGTCNSPPGPLPEPICRNGDVCCTAGGGGDKLCIQVQASPLTFSCAGNPCRFEDNASTCN